MLEETPNAFGWFLGFESAIRATDEPEPSHETEVEDPIDPAIADT